MSPSPASVSTRGDAQMGGNSELRAVVHNLAAIRRPSASLGEALAAAHIARLLEEAGGGRTRCENEEAFGTYWWPLGALMTITVAAGLAGRRVGLVAGALAGYAAWDDLVAGRRWFRRVVARRRRTVNVVAEFGPADAEDVVIVSAHHDAARTGEVFRPAVLRALSRLSLRLTGSTPPVMWPVVAGPGLLAIGCASRSPLVTKCGVTVAGSTLLTLLDIAGRDIVPGANDNLTGVAVLVSLARQLGDEAPTATRVVLLSTGSEESGLEGMRAFMSRHASKLDTGRTKLVCLDTLGSEQLVLARREGLLRTRPYSGRLRTLLRQCAAEGGIPLRRSLVLRSATDGWIALKAGFEAVMVGSVDSAGSPGNYHWPTDTPDRVRWKSVEGAAQLCLRLIRKLDSNHGSR